MTQPPDPFGGGDEREALEELMRRLASGHLDAADLQRLQQEIGSALGVQLDPAQLQMAMAQVSAMMNAPDTGPVNWNLAQDTARKVVAAGSDPSVGPNARREAVEALRVASLWLDPVTTLPSPGAVERAWSRSEWVEATLPTWHELSLPVAERVSAAMTAALAEQVPEEMREMVGQAGALMRKVGGSVFAMQVGQAVGSLAGEVVSGFDIGLPLTPSGTTALLPVNVAAFGEGLDVPAEEVRLYLALREAAHARLFGHAGWLRSHLLSAVQEFAGGIEIDTDALQDAVRSVDPSDPAAIQQAIQGGLFQPERTPAQQAVLTRLETTLALVEGWVDEVTDAAARDQLPGAGRLREAVRRRRATGGPAEHVLATLVGLELRPRRLRDAAALWGAMAAQHGTEARDEVWDHPDLVPGTDDLDDPIGYAQGWAQREAASDEMDAALRDLLDGGTGDDPGKA
jgi:putative hydrolase